MSTDTDPYDDTRVRPDEAADRDDLTAASVDPVFGAQPTEPAEGTPVVVPAVLELGEHELKPALEAVLMIADTPLDHLSLAQAVGFFAGTLQIEPAPSRIGELFQELSKYDDDFGDVRGQEMAKRAIVVAASGNHNILMLGPPGSGKTMLAKRVPTICPALTAAESIETTRIYSSLGRLAPGQPLMARRPYRAPHHTISEPGLVGGGNPPVPGEISLSHNGVYHLRIGNSIYLRLLMAMDAAGSLDFGGDILNAQLDAVADLVETDFGSYAGSELGGRVYHPPTYLTELYEQDDSLVFGDDCIFIRAVAFGEPPPPGYRPEPSWLDRGLNTSP